MVVPSPPRMVALLDSSAATGAVLATAEAFAEVIGVRLDAFHVTTEAAATARKQTDLSAGVTFREIEGVLPDTLVDLVDQADVVVAVIGARGQPNGPRPAGHVALSLLAKGSKPLLVVPPDGRRDGFRKALIPLDGTAETAEAVENLVGLFADAGIEVVPLHVLGPATMPHYWDQPAHEPEVWGTEFLRRLWHTPRAPLQLRSGAVGRQILDAAQVLDIDLIVLAWTQHLDPGRSRVLQDVIAASTVPVLVVPIRKLDGSSETLMLQRTGPHRNRPRGERAPATEHHGQL